MSDFLLSSIDINAGSDAWGPFEFDFANSIPSGASLSSCVVSSSLNGVSTTSVLIESGSTGVTGSTVHASFQYPGASYHGSHLLSFALTLSTGAKHRFDFRWVNVGA